MFVPLVRALFLVTLNNTWNNVTDYYYISVGPNISPKCGAFSSHALAPRANSSLFAVLVPLVLAIYLGSGRSERRLSLRRWCEEIFERDEEIERNGKGKCTKHLSYFRSSATFSRLSVSFICYSLILLLWLLHEASSLDYRSFKWYLMIKDQTIIFFRLSRIEGFYFALVRF